MADHSVGDSGFQVTLILIWMLFLYDGTKKKQATLLAFRFWSFTVNARCGCYMTNTGGQCSVCFAGLPVDTGQSFRFEDRDCKDLRDTWHTACQYPWKKNSAFLSSVTSENTATAVNILIRNGTQKHQQQWNIRSDWHAPVITLLYLSRSRSIECWTCVKLGTSALCFITYSTLFYPQIPRDIRFKKKTLFECSFSLLCSNVNEWYHPSRQHVSSEWKIETMTQ